MKRVMFLVLGMLLLAGMAFANGQQEESAAAAVAVNANGVIQEGPFKGVKVLDEEVDITLGHLAGGTHGFPTYLVERLGGYDAVGLDAEIVIFGNGPIMVESVDSGGWDAGCYGLGGTFSGTIGHDVINIGAASRDFHSLWVFATPDSAIVKAGKNVPESPLLYGDAESWKGAEVYLPIGTTLQYSLMLGLAKFGLDANDIKMVHMDVPNVNAAMRAGKVEVGGLWSNFAYNKEINERFVPVIQAGDVGVFNTTVMAVAPASYEDPVKYEAVKKWAELYFKAVDWIQASEANFELAIDYFLEWNEDNGIKADRSDLVKHMTYSNHFTLEENYEMFTTKTDDGSMLLVEKYQVDPLDFFISNGNYTKADREKLLGGYFKADMLKEIMAEQKANM